MDIRNVSSATSLDAVLKLRPVTYKWKRNAPGLMAENHGTQLGFIAQDVRDAVPRNLSKSVVTHIGNEDFLGITSNSMTPLLTGAVQEQQLTIKNLQTLVEELQDRVEKLELRVSSLS